MYKKHKRQGLEIIIMTNNPAQKIKSYATSNGMNMPIAIGGGAGYGVRGIPKAFLINHKGVVVWQGNPSRGAWDSAAQKALAAMPKGLEIEGNYPDRFDYVLRKLRDKKYSSAISKLERMVKKDDGKAKELMNKVVAYAKGQLKLAGEYADSKDYIDAIKLYRDLEKDFRSLDKVSDKAKKLRKKLERSKEVKNEIKAARYFARGEFYEQKGKYAYFVKAYKVYAYIAKKYPDTKAGKKAAQHMQSLKNSGEFKYNSRCFQCRGKGRTCSKCKRR